MDSLETAAIKFDGDYAYTQKVVDAVKNVTKDDRYCDVESSDQCRTA